MTLPEKVDAKNNPANYLQNIKLHSSVEVVLKKDQKTGKLTLGKVRGILTSKPYHSRGIKVILESRKIGRVQKIIEETSSS
jgi:uncharacterized repeat protein (TIGR03833 family)